MNFDLSPYAHPEAGLPGFETGTPERALLDALRAELCADAEVTGGPVDLAACYARTCFPQHFQRLILVLYAPGLKRILVSRRGMGFEAVFARLLAHPRRSRFARADFRLQMDFVLEAPSPVDFYTVGSARSGELHFEAGLDGLFYRGPDGKVNVFLPGDAYVRSVMTMGQLRTALNKAHGEDYLRASRFERFRSESFLSGSDRWLRLYRGYPVVGALTREKLENALALAVDHIQRTQDEHGRFLYYYDAARDSRRDHEHPGRDPDKNPYYNILRHGGGGLTCIYHEKWTRRGDALENVRRAIEYLIATSFRSTPYGGREGVYVYSERKSKLGGAGIALYLISDYQLLTGDRRYQAWADKLAWHLVNQITASGEFIYYNIYLDRAIDAGSNRNYFSFYYPGEAVCGLAKYLHLIEDGARAPYFDKLHKALAFLLVVRPHTRADQYTAVPSDAWLMMGIMELWDFPAMRDSLYSDFVFSDAQKMVDHMYTVSSAPCPDYAGGFYYEHGDFPYADGARCEGLLGAYALAIKMGERERARGLWPALRLAAWAVMHLVNTQDAIYFAANPGIALGGIRFKYTRQWFRIDTIQHVASFYAKLLPFWDAAEQEFERDLQAAQQSEVAAAVEFDPATVTASGSRQGGRLAAVVVWGGDVNLGRRQHYRSAELGAANVLRIPALADADLRIANLECVVATCGEQGVRKGEGGAYYFRARPEMLRILVAAGIDVVATANNHSGDYGPDALLEQGRWLDAVGIAHAGSGADVEEAFAPALRRAGDLNVAVFSLDATQQRFAATAAGAGAAYLSPADPQAWKEVMTARITAVRTRAHVVLVAVHSGPNRAERPGADEISIARALIEAGADAVLGASAHVPQGIEIHHGRPIIHDAGDLLFDAIHGRLYDGGVFRLELSPNGVERVEFVPIGVGFGYSEQRTGRDAHAATDRYAKSCAALATQMTQTEDGAGVVTLAPGSRTAPVCEAAQATRYDLTALEALEQSSHRSADEGRVAAVPERARIDPVRIGPLTLLGVRVEPTEITTRRMLWVETFWRADEAMEEDVRLDIRGVPVRTTRMQAWGRSMDHDPCDWMVPTSRWQPGAIYRDYYGLRPPYLSKWSNVDLQLTVGLVSALHPVEPVSLPVFIKLAVPGKDEPGARIAPPVYRTTFAPTINECLPGQTWTAQQLVEVTGGAWVVEPPPGWFVRSVVSGAKHIGMLPGPVLYVAHDALDRYRHEQSRPPVSNVDRHMQLPRLAPGLAGSIVAKDVAGLPDGFPLLRVRDPIQCMIELGIAARQRYTGNVIAVTGTAGKSTTVGMLQHMLGGPQRVLASIDNYNSRVGAPCMLASLAPDHEAAIIEVAQSALWMKRGPVTRLVRPTVALITEIGVSQTDKRVKSVHDTAKWKSRVFDGLCGDAVAIVGEHLACFDEVLAAARKHAKRVVVFGRSAQAEVRIIGLQTDERGTLVELHTPAGVIHLRVPLPGPGMVNNAVAALCVLHAIGRDLVAGAQSLADFTSEQGRLERLRLALPGGEIDVIDDSWNATVSSMLNSFSVLGATKPQAGGRKVTVLGRIVHLGELARPLHEGLAEPLLATGVDLVITHGEEMQYLRALLPERILGPHFSGAVLLVEYLRSALCANDLVLIKGSRRDSDFGRIGGLLRAGS